MSKKPKNGKITRRAAIKKAAYVSPTLLTLAAAPAFAQRGSGGGSSGGDGARTGGGGSTGGGGTRG